MGHSSPEYKRAYYQKNRERVLEQQRQLRVLHPERVKHQNEKYKAENPDKIKELNHAYYNTHKDQYLENARKQRRENPEKHREKNRRWREANKEKMQEMRDAWESANPGKKKELEAQWREDNKIHIYKKGQKRYAEKKDHILETCKKWQKNNPEKARKLCSRRRARLRHAAIGDEEAIVRWNTEWRAKESVECHYCKGSFPPSKCDQDHAVPLSRGGAHDISNLVIACLHCNRQKHAKTPEEWAALKGLTTPPLPHPLPASQIQSLLLLCVAS